MKQKRAQIFTTDFIIGFVIFFALLIVGINLVISLVPSVEYETLYKDNTYISQILTTPGYPTNWTSTDAILPGLIANGKVSEDKLNNLTALGYDRTRALYHITGDFAFYFENSTQLLNITKCIHGYALVHNASCHPDYNSINYDNLVRTERLVVYNTSIIRMVVLSWQ